MRAVTTTRALSWGHGILLLNWIMMLYHTIINLILPYGSLWTNRRVFIGVSLTGLIGCVSPEKVPGFGALFWISLDVGIGRRHHGHILLIFKLTLRRLTECHLVCCSLHVDSCPRVGNNLRLVTMYWLLLVWILKNRKVIDLSIFLRNFLRVHLFLNCKKTIIIL